MMGTMYRFDPFELLSAYRTVKRFFPVLKLLEPYHRNPARDLKGVYIAPHPHDNTSVLVYTLSPRVCYRTEVKLHGVEGDMRDLFIDNKSLRDFEAFLKDASECAGFVRATLPTSKWSTRVDWGCARCSIFTVDLKGGGAVCRRNCDSLFMDTRSAEHPVIKVEAGDLSDIPEYLHQIMQKARVTPMEILVEIEPPIDYCGDDFQRRAFVVMENGDRLTTFRVESEVR